MIKIHERYRPVQIAKQLGMEEGHLGYYIRRLKNDGLVIKTNYREQGIMWTLSEKAKAILKEKLSGSVNDQEPLHKQIVCRVHNLTYDFSIKKIPTTVQGVEWRQLKNNVRKCKIEWKKDNASIELIESPNEWMSRIQIHLSERYDRFPEKALSLAQEEARMIAKATATKYQLEIDETPKLEKRPHYAFETDLTAKYLGTRITTEVKTDNGRAWIDSSNGEGEFETDDPYYAYQYLMMPKTVSDIESKLDRLSKAIASRNSTYLQAYHFRYTMNN